MSKTRRKVDSRPAFPPRHMRQVRPAIWTDENVAELSITARLFFIGLWNFADKNGAFVWRPKTLRAQILPYDNVEVSDLLTELLGRNLVTQYSVDGEGYGLISDWRLLQNVSGSEAEEPAYYPQPSSAITLDIPSCPVDVPSRPPDHRRSRSRSGIGSRSRSRSRSERGSGRVCEANAAPDSDAAPQNQLQPRSLSLVGQDRPGSHGKTPAERAVYDVAKAIAGIPTASRVEFSVGSRAKEAIGRLLARGVTPERIIWAATRIAAEKVGPTEEKPGIVLQDNLEIVADSLTEELAKNAERDRRMAEVEVRERAKIEAEIEERRRQAELGQQWAAEPV